MPPHILSSASIVRIGALVIQTTGNGWIAEHLVPVDVGI
jgi:hypothetical protein